MCVAKILSVSAIDLLLKPELIVQAKEEFINRKKQHDEIPLIPEGLKAPIELRWPEWVSRPGQEWWTPPT